MFRGGGTLRRTLVPLALWGGLTALWACDGQNLFSVDRRLADGAPPKVRILQPKPPAARPVGDSVLVTARASDDTGVDSVVFRGLAFRGDRNLGTDTVVARFQAKVVKLPSGIRDTTVSRYLLPTPNTERETAVLYAVAYDAQGNAAQDSVLLIIGGPRVEFRTLRDGQQVQAGLSLNLQVEASDPSRIAEVVIEISGAFQSKIEVPIAVPADTILVDTAVVVPTGITGTANVVATARNTLGVTGQVGPISLRVVSATVVDVTPPRLSMKPVASERLELTDPLQVAISGSDDAQGKGVARAGFTVRAISPRRGDTLVRTQERVFSPPRTGNLAVTFSFLPFNVNEQALPDTLVFEFTGWMVDGEGNCAATVTADEASSLPCGNLGTGERVAEGRTGLRLTRIVVAGKTVKLPMGGRIMDAVVDTIRKNLLLSNIERNRVEVFRLPGEVFGPAIGVGSEPWGLSLNRAGDRLLVANSGGTNISVVDLTRERELEQERFFIPPVVIFDLELKVGDSGVNFLVYPFPTTQAPSFSDRPQYLAVDAFGNIVYSTRTTLVGNIGTARKAYHPAGAPRSEVKLFVEHGAFTLAEDFWAFAHIDSIGVGVDTIAVDSLGNPLMAAALTLFDHLPGFPDSVIWAKANTGSLDPVFNAWANLRNQGSDAFLAAAARWNIPSFGFADPTFVTASGDGSWVLVGEGGTSPVGRVLLYRAAQHDTTKLSDRMRVWNEVINASDVVRGVGLNYDGTLGMARGASAYFFDTELQLNGRVALPRGGGGSGAAFHPLHASQRTLQNFAGAYRPDTHIAFVGTADGTIDIVDTFKFTRIGQITIRDPITGPLRAILPFEGDNAGKRCAVIPVQDRRGIPIGQAVQLYQNGDFTRPLPPDGVTEDACIVVKLFATTAAEGVVVVPVRKSDILKYHPNR